MKLPVLTNSQMKTFRRCPRLHYFMYVLLFRVIEDADALRFGTLVHLGLEAWWLSATEKLEAALVAMKPHARDEYEYARAKVMLAGYHARWLAESEHYEVVSVEYQFRAPLLNPETGARSRTFDLGGKLDVIVYDLRDRKIKMVEHKTTSEDIGAGSDYWKRLAIDPQVSTYFAGGKAAGYDIDTCIYDVLKKTGHRPSGVPLTDADGVKIVLDAAGERVRTKDGKKWRESGDTEKGYVLQTRPETAEEFEARLMEAFAANPEKFYDRGTVVRLEAEEQDAAYDAWQTSQLIREAERANRWPRNPDACVQYGTCGFFGVCTGTASLDDTSKFRRLEWAHEELDQTRIDQAA